MTFYTNHSIQPRGHLTGAKVAALLQDALSSFARVVLSAAFGACSMFFATLAIIDVTDPATAFSAIAVVKLVAFLGASILMFFFCACIMKRRSIHVFGNR